MENHYVREAVAKRAVSPGPGHYVNVNVAVSPQKTVRASRATFSNASPLPSSSSSRPIAVSTEGGRVSAIANQATPSSSSILTDNKHTLASLSTTGSKNTATNPPLDRASLLGSPLVGSKGYSFSKERLGRFSYAGQHHSSSTSSPSPTRADRGTH